MRKPPAPCAATLALAAVLSAALGTDARAAATTAEFAAPALRSEHVDNDDLLTAGLGIAGLRGPVPVFVDPLHPTVGELRRRAIWQNYRGLIDASDAGGYGRLYGAIGELRVPGVEYLAALRRPRGEGSTTLLLQVPRDFSLRKPCLLVVAASGSRGIYGALPTAGEWGLRHGCAVAHSDKGSGFWDVDRGIGMRIDGQLTPRRDDPYLTFQPPPAEPSASDLHRLLLRHANSGVNPEAQWGEYLLQALDGALQLLNAEFAARLAKPLTPANTTIIAAGISNGGGAVLRAAELDAAGWIDGVVAAEPNVAVDAALPVLQLQRGAIRAAIHTRPLYDYATLLALLQPCAALAEGSDALPLSAAAAGMHEAQAAWCAQLAEAALVSGTDRQAQSLDARTRLLEAGIEPAALRLAYVNLQFALMPSITSTYAAAYARSGAGAQPCDIRFTAVDAQGASRPLDLAELARLFSDSNGLAPTAGIVDLRGDRPARDFATALCLRNLLPSLKNGLQEIQMSANTGRRPVIVLHGRDDGLIAVNHASRAWFALRQQRAYATAVRYYEIEHVQHFDAFLPLPQVRDAYLPMQPFLDAALNLMWQRLTMAKALPASQLWRTQPGRQPLASAQIGALRRSPGRDRIRVVSRTLIVPD